MARFRDRDFTSEVQSIESTAGGKLVTVRVLGPTAAPNVVRELRAQGRALLAVGFLGTTADRVADIARGDLEKFTETVSGPRNITEGDIFIGQEWTIKVNRT